MTPWQVRKLKLALKEDAFIGDAIFAMQPIFHNTPLIKFQVLDADVALKVKNALKDL